jgi:hypothetical protein
MGLIKDGREQHYMWALMCAIYVILLSWVVYQVARIVYFKHRLKSFQGLFLVLCLFWTTLRVVFWLENTNGWVNWKALIIYFMPSLIQFSMFSLLVFFYAKLVHLREWNLVKVRCYLAYAVSNLLFSSVTVYWIIVEQHDYNYDDVKFYFSLFSGILFAVLTAALTWYGGKVYRLQLSNRMRMLHPFASATAMVGLTLLASVVFFTRSLYGLLQAIGGWGIMPIPVGASRAESAAGAAAVLGWKVIDYPTFVMNITWEILPTVALLHFFRSIPRSRDNLLRNIQRFLFGSKHYVDVPSVLSTPTSNSGQEVLSSDNEIVVSVHESDSNKNNNDSGGSASSTPTVPRRINVRVETSSSSNRRQHSRGGDTLVPSTADSNASTDIVRSGSGSGSRASNNATRSWWPARNSAGDRSDSDSSPFRGAESADKFAFTPGIGWNLPPPVKGRSGSVEPRDLLFRASSPSAKPAIFPTRKKKSSSTGKRKHSRHLSAEKNSTGDRRSSSSPRK